MNVDRFSFKHITSYGLQYEICKNKHRVWMNKNIFTNAKSKLCLAEMLWKWKHLLNAKAQPPIQQLLQPWRCACESAHLPRLLYKINSQLNIRFIYSITYIVQGSFLVDSGSSDIMLQDDWRTGKSDLTHTSAGQCLIPAAHQCLPVICGQGLLLLKQP